MKNSNRASKNKKWKAPRRFARQMPVKRVVNDMYSQMLDDLLDEGVERDAYDTIANKQERCREINAFG